MMAFATHWTYSVQKKYVLSQRLVFKNIRKCDWFLAYNMAVMALSNEHSLRTYFQSLHTQTQVSHYKTGNISAPPL